MSDEFLREVEPHLERLARGPGNAGALESLRAAFAQARADAALGPAAELAHSAENLLSALLEGYAAPTDETTELVAEAARGLFALDSTGRADLAERMDATASGIDTAKLDALPQPPHTGRPEPPLLTEREDGVIVTPGMFSDDADGVSQNDAAQNNAPLDSPESLGYPTPAGEAFEPPVASTTVAPQLVADAYPEANATAEARADLGDLAGDIDTAIDHLDRQISALITIASGNDETSTAVQHTAGELATTAAELKRHYRALVQWAEGRADVDRGERTEQSDDQDARLDDQEGLPRSPLA